MTPDELLKPRYKIIADYPFSTFPKGEILELNKLDAKKHLVDQEYYMVYKENCYNESLLNKYPAIFKKLEWWEDRKESDMPQYVKSSNRVYSAENYKYLPYVYVKELLISSIDISRLLPATKEEYENKKHSL